jgi:Domain of unknown function (DUF4252)
LAVINRVWWAAWLLPAVAMAQDIPLDLFASLAPKGTETVEVSLGGTMLQLAGQFLNTSDPEQAKVKTLLNGLKGIYVRSYTFKKAGDFSMADVDRVREKLKGWSPVVNVHNAEESTGVYLKTNGQKIDGLVVLSAEPTQLTLVNIVGSIRVEDLKELSGKFGIPELGDLGDKGSKKRE